MLGYEARNVFRRNLAQVARANVRSMACSALPYVTPLYEQWLQCHAGGMPGMPAQPLAVIASRWRQELLFRSLFHHV